MLQTLKKDCVHGFRLEYSTQSIHRQEHSFVAADEIFLSSFKRGMMLYSVVSFLLTHLIGDKVHVFLPDQPDSAVVAVVTRVWHNSISVTCKTTNVYLEPGQDYRYVVNVCIIYLIV